MVKKITEKNKQPNLQPEDYHKLKSLLEQLEQKYNLSAIEILTNLQQTQLIPITVFEQKKPLTSLVKYVIDHYHISFSELGRITNRSSKTIWQAYHSGKCSKSKTDHKTAQYFLPVSLFHKKELSILETVVQYIHEKHHLPFHTIAKLIQRDERTIWTVYHRVQQKEKKLND